MNPFERYANSPLRDRPMNGGNEVVHECNAVKLVTWPQSLFSVALRHRAGLIHKHRAISWIAEAGHTPKVEPTVSLRPYVYLYDSRGLTISVSVAKVIPIPKSVGMRCLDVVGSRRRIFFEFKVDQGLR